MKRVPCSYERCEYVHIHHESTADKGVHATVEVSDDWNGPYIFCSITCAVSAGKFNLKRGWIHDQVGKSYNDTWTDVYESEKASRG